MIRRKENGFIKCISVSETSSGRDTKRELYAVPHVIIRRPLFGIPLGETFK